MRGWLELWRYARADRARMWRLSAIIATAVICAAVIVATLAAVIAGTS